MPHPIASPRRAGEHMKRLLLPFDYLQRGIDVMRSERANGTDFADRDTRVLLRPPGHFFLALVLGALALCTAGAKTPAPAVDSAALEEAFVYALPVFEVARFRYAGTAARPADKSALNRLMHRRTL